MKIEKLKEDKNEVPIFVLSMGIPILLALILSLNFFGTNLFTMVTLVAIASLIGLFVYSKLNKNKIEIKTNKLYNWLLWIILAILIIFVILSTVIWLI